MENENLLQALRATVDANFFISNPDGSAMSRKEISEYLGVSYGYACKLLREAFDRRDIAEFKVGTNAFFIANPFRLYDNPTVSPTLTLVFKNRGVA